MLLNSKSIFKILIQLMLVSSPFSNATMEEVGFSFNGKKMFASSVIECINDIFGGVISSKVNMLYFHAALTYITVFDQQFFGAAKRSRELFLQVAAVDELDIGNFSTQPSNAGGRICSQLSSLYTAKNVNVTNSNGLNTSFINTNYIRLKSTGGRSNLRKITHWFSPPFACIGIVAALLLIKPNLLGVMSHWISLNKTVLFSWDDCKSEKCKWLVASNTFECHEVGLIKSPKDYLNSINCDDFPQGYYQN